MIRVVFWNDANGSTFVMAKIGNDWFEDHDIIVEDCTVQIIVIAIAMSGFRSVSGALPCLDSQVVYARRMLPAASPGGIYSNFFDKLVIRERFIEK